MPTLWSVKGCKAEYQAAMAGAKRIVAVVVNYRTPELTIKAVRSLQASDYPLHAIVVVDNGSADDSDRQIRSSVQDIRLIGAPTNGGFSAGCKACQSGRL